MENTNQHNKNFNPKYIVLLLIFIFILFVAYKYISSGIDEKRQESILEEQANESLLAKEPLNQCLKNVEIVLERKSADVRSMALTSNQPKTVALCESENIKWTGKKGNCITTLDEVNIEIQRYNIQAEMDKQECYKQYK